VGCKSRALTGFAARIDVDLIGVADDPNRPWVDARNVYCRTKI
jgi:hypothetical protein